MSFDTENVCDVDVIKVLHRLRQISFLSTEVSLTFETIVSCFIFLIL